MLSSAVLNIASKCSEKENEHRFDLRQTGPVTVFYLRAGKSFKLYISRPLGSPKHTPSDVNLAGKTHVLTRQCVLREAKGAVYNKVKTNALTWFAAQKNT